ncbi:type II toxin-antitoxin system HicB family antitoxin [Fundidesulfovibrio agrisoli]|uniref:type II toxin-antitoxin system HicB family antitoxin n=1 Tax=Fundidesulfovibrio agrisoli TaxID=2922717 RepID=UPI001FAB6084|nr:type II toxin-antitoxin system HicB family antitoxin [Fundidesulfovibrio agrisoli]
MRKHYPVILHTDDGVAYGVTVPDLPGCFTSGDTLEEALSNVQEAVEAFLFDADKAPEPSAPGAVLALAEAEGGVLAFVELDLAFLDKEPVRVNISVPRFRLERIDAAAKKLGLTRSGFLVQAAEALAERKHP